MRLVPVLALFLLPIAAGAPASPFSDTPVYDLRLRDTDPRRIDFALSNMPRGELLIAASESAGRMLRAAPTCDGKPLRRQRPGSWLKPAGCTTISWSVSLPEFDPASFDASRPVPFWNGRNRLWLLTGSLPWMRFKDQPAAAVHIRAQVRDEDISREAVLPADASNPVYILIGNPSRRYSAGSVTMSAYGDVPPGTSADELQNALAMTLERWRHDILPDDADARDQFDYAWFQGSSNASPGVFASSGSDAILMQFAPDRQSTHPYAKVEAAILLIGAHEGFHSLGASLPGTKPAWLNESLASFFAYEAARRVLTGVPLKLAEDLVSAPAEHPVLHAQKLLNGGDDSGYGTFYTRGARFWAAIDEVLAIQPNRSGRLAALIKRTRGMPEVDWSDANSIASYLDRHSDGRAGPVVRCYLVESQCKAAIGGQPAPRQPVSEID